MSIAQFSLILSRGFWKAHLDTPLENLDNVFSRMAHHVVAMLRDEGVTMALLQPLSMGQSDTHVDVIFSGDVDMLGTLPACALPVRGDLLELNDKTYLVVQRRWIMEGGRRTAVNLQLKDSYRLGKLFESQKDTATP